MNSTDWTGRKLTDEQEELVMKLINNAMRYGKECGLSTIEWWKTLSVEELRKLVPSHKCKTI